MGKSRIIATSAGKCRIGTSGIVLPVANKAAMPAVFQTQPRLAYYASLFNSLEINSSFYKTPMAVTFEKWAATVGEDFQFTVKLSRDITHAKDFVYDPSEIDRFIKAANGIGSKKGCLLIQFPPSFRRSDSAAGSLQNFLQLVWQSDPEHSWKWAVEFRHPSWYEDGIYKLLEKWKASLVLHDMPGSAIVLPDFAADFIYLRFHGPAGDYRGGYSSEVLQSYADRIRIWQEQGKDVYVYFNNTIGDAVDNAQHLLGLTRRLSGAIG